MKKMPEATVNSPIFGPLREASPGEIEAIERLVAELPNKVFAVLNKRFNELGLALSIAKLPEGFSQADER